MAARVLVMVETGLVGRIGDVRKLGHAFANSFGEVVDVAVVPPESMEQAREGVDRRFSPIVPIRPSPAVSGMPGPSMGTAPFVYDSRGRANWAGMWESFCELALFGGPPHRGPERALRANGRPAARRRPRRDPFDPVAEIRRGIEATTGLATAPAAPGWLAVTCESPRMAAWLCATIILENVDARAEGATLLIPASDAYRLEDEVKSVITVVAKTHHYWLAHARAARGGNACSLSSSRSR
jgi:sirohydrochlorin cobaltochelatase